MFGISKSTTKSIGKLFWFFGMVNSSIASSAEFNNGAHEYVDFLADVNNVSALEHAGSHGSLGFGLGLGVSSFAAPSNTQFFDEHWRPVGSTPDLSHQIRSRIFIPRVYFHKGLPWPIDIGLSTGRDPLTNASLTSGYTQWTVFEGFALPALAVRGTYSRLMGLPTTDVSGVSIDGVASYSFLRILTLYGSIGFSRNDIVVRHGASYGTNYSLVVDDPRPTLLVKSNRTRSFGVQIQLKPPFYTFSMEGRDMGRGSQTILGKFTVGM